MRSEQLDFQQVKIIHDRVQKEALYLQHQTGRMHQLRFSDSDPIFAKAVVAADALKDYQETLAEIMKDKAPATIPFKTS